MSGEPTTEFGNSSAIGPSTTRLGTSWQVSIRSSSEFVRLETDHQKKEVYTEPWLAVDSRPESLVLKRSHGIRNKGRAVLRRKPRDRGKIPLGSLLRNYSQGQRVLISVNPAVHKGMPHRRYHGRMGTVSEKRGRSYVLEVEIGGKYPRTIIARPEHIKPMEGQ